MCRATQPSRQSLPLLEVGPARSCQEAATKLTRSCLHSAVPPGWRTAATIETGTKMAGVFFFLHHTGLPELPPVTCRVVCYSHAAAPLLLVPCTVKRFQVRLGVPGGGPVLSLGEAACSWGRWKKQPIVGCVWGASGSGSMEDLLDSRCVSSVLGASSGCCN